MCPASLRISSRASGILEAMWRAWAGGVRRSLSPTAISVGSARLSSTSERSKLTRLGKTLAQTSMSVPDSRRSVKATWPGDGLEPKPNSLVPRYPKSLPRRRSWLARTGSWPMNLKLAAVVADQDPLDRQADAEAEHDPARGHADPPHRERGRRRLPPRPRPRLPRQGRLGLPRQRRVRRPREGGLGPASQGTRFAA